MNDRTSIRLRAQEILLANPAGMTTHEAMKRALAERFKDDPPGLLEFAATSSGSLLRGLRQRTYELQQPSDLSLFEAPPVIGITTPDGDLLISTDMAITGHVRQWHRERGRWLATQTLRGHRFAEQSLDPISDIDDEVPWTQARALLRARRVAELEALAQEATDQDGTNL